MLVDSKFTSIRWISCDATKLCQGVNHPNRFTKSLNKYEFSFHVGHVCRNFQELLLVEPPVAAMPMSDLYKHCIEQMPKPPLVCILTGVGEACMQSASMQNDSPIEPYLARVS